ncbi:ABC transporter ATP-binding protein [Flexivirga endophytica]|uniref:ABC transporter ATP-binding protein n=1 Tax=Flexivirga endophytica TaxID=1849103 RepID=A0A916TJ70_9MICO|nr:ABC transporter ATP-binding protein [Flexivirga endophytica]GGB46479.1 ABC transporter ATP-binding protein [Flexivirga endophytica]GHB70223.1 ABC transporter ATP-binding protein [Flexivirga endophytica]
MTELDLTDVSRWYGNVVAVNDVNMHIGPGITGLLGPNGAGKSTLLSMMAGLLPPSAGTVTIDGRPTRANIAIYRQIGLVPVQESLYDFLTGEQFVRLNAELQKVPQPGLAAKRAIGLVEMSDAADRKISTYSKGMKQRIKVASALTHDPAVLLLDEPFNGMDPIQRRHMMALLTQFAEQGRTIVFSSHILEEVEQIARQVEVVVAGRHAASGDFAAIRRLMTDRPNQYLVRSSDDRRLAALLLAEPCVRGARLRGDTALEVEADDFGGFAQVIPKVARDNAIRVFEVTPTDESLESVFSYLVNS